MKTQSPLGGIITSYPLATALNIYTTPFHLPWPVSTMTEAATRSFHYPKDHYYGGSKAGGETAAVGVGGSQIGEPVAMTCKNRLASPVQRCTQGPPRLSPQKDTFPVLFYY